MLVYIYVPLSLSHTHTHSLQKWSVLIPHSKIVVVVCVCVCVCVVTAGLELGRLSVCDVIIDWQLCVQRFSIDLVTMDYFIPSCIIVIYWPLVSRRASDYEVD